MFIFCGRPRERKRRKRKRNWRIITIKQQQQYRHIWAVNMCQSNVKSLSRVQLFATPWTVAYQTPPSMGFSRQAYWSGLPLLSPFVFYYRLITKEMLPGNVNGPPLRSPASQVMNIKLKHLWVVEPPWPGPPMNDSREEEMNTSPLEAQLEPDIFVFTSYTFS